MKDYIKFAIGFIAFMAMYCTACGVDLNTITIKHAAIRFVIIIFAAIIGIVIAVVRQEREEE